MDGTLALNDVLAITYTSGHSWVPDGRGVAYIYDDGGRCSLRLAEIEHGIVTEISRGEGAVTEFAWGPGGALAYVQAGQLYLGRVPRAGAAAREPALLYGPAALSRTRTGTVMYGFVRHSGAVPAAE